MAFTSAQKNAAAATAFAAMGNSGGGGLKKVSGNLPATYMNEFGATATRGSTDKKAKVVGRNKTENLAYPLSVEGDPGQGHYIIFYAKVTPNLYYIGFIPGLLATVLGTMLAGRAIYKREMAELFKELET